MVPASAARSRGPRIALRPLARTRPKPPGPLDYLAALVWTDEGPVELSQNAAAILTVLLLRADNGSGFARPIALPYLGADARSSRTGAWRGLQELEELGLVTPVPTTTTTGNGANAYQLNVPRLMELYAGTARAARAATVPIRPPVAPADPHTPEGSDLGRSGVPDRNGSSTPDLLLFGEREAPPTEDPWTGDTHRSAMPAGPGCDGAASTPVRLDAAASAILAALESTPDLAPIASPLLARRLAADEVGRRGIPLARALRGLAELAEHVGDAAALDQPWPIERLRRAPRSYIRGARSPEEGARGQRPRTSVVYAPPDPSPPTSIRDKAIATSLIAGAAQVLDVIQRSGDPFDASPPRRGR